MKESQNNLDHPSSTSTESKLEVYGPPEPDPGWVYGPEPQINKAIVLVLGPGMARGFAHIGVLRALSEAKISIAAVLGTEMGGLIGSVYAVDPNINHFEWALLRFNEELFTPSSGGFVPTFIEKKMKSKKLDTQLKLVFGGKKLEDSKLPIRIAVQPKRSSAPMILERGDFVSSIRAALTDEQLYNPTMIDGLEVGSASLSRPFTIREAKALSAGPVVVVDVTAPDHLSSDVKRELLEADLVIRPDLSGITAQDYNKRTEAAYRGRVSITSHLPEILKLTGDKRGP